MALLRCRSMGSDVFDYGGMGFASQTFSGKDGVQITSSWVLEGPRIVQPFFIYIFCALHALAIAAPCLDLLARVGTGVQQVGP